MSLTTKLRQDQWVVVHLKWADRRNRVAGTAMAVGTIAGVAHALGPALARTWRGAWRSWSVNNEVIPSPGVVEWAEATGRRDAAALEILHGRGTVVRWAKDLPPPAGPAALRVRLELRETHTGRSRAWRSRLTGTLAAPPEFDVDVALGRCRTFGVPARVPLADERDAAIELRALELRPRRRHDG
jgi:hypothetical protein